MRKVTYVSPQEGTTVQSIQVKSSQVAFNKQESPAIADKPARRESMPKSAPIRRAYNVVADNTGLTLFV